MDRIKRLKEIIDASENLVVFTGAGISCPSGIPDFRSSDGLYNRESKYNYSPEEIISHSFFTEHTDLFYDFYKSAMLYPEAIPNKAHKYFASLQKNKNVSVITQNIDGLHSDAGSLDVTELHGSVRRNYCTECGRFYPVDYIINSVGIPRCSEDGGIIKPDVVLYEEPLCEKDINRAVNAIERADTLIVVGTSLVVYPAAMYLRYFAGEHLILINKSSTSYDGKAEITINDDIIKVIDEIEKLP